MFVNCLPTHLGSDEVICIVVTPETTVHDIREALPGHRGHSRCQEHGNVYLLGVRQPLQSSSTMKQLKVQALSHFIIAPRILGGVPSLAETNGWEQCAENPDGSLKDAADIDFGTDPGANDNPAGPSTRQPRGKDKRMHEAILMEQETEESPQPRKRKSGRRQGTKSNGKQKAGTVSDPDDHVYLESETETEIDSDGNAEITLEENNT
ncbi:hypothetical protein BDP27DRAFT_821633 [Rhodocollybia butyracea]|uniref:Uncharacterized protein n=1 Tax=Rhodocollybia butyracea TaxID=206335 RepID=A0A9P5TWC6_9AGAR|nr:hypothetical protein BDP27DRAFT_821633 [Rhodocollybia butyracea]